MKVSPIIASFNAGEWSPLMAGRTDLKTYNAACRRMRNIIPAVQGPARRRPGTHFVAEVKNSANPTHLMPFIYNQDTAYVIECSDFFFRFFSNHGVVGAPFELAVPWGWANYIRQEDGSFRLRGAQLGDVQYIVGGSSKPQKLTRTGVATFTIADVNFEGGPFMDVDPDKTVTMYSNLNTGAAATFTASAATFQPDPLNLNMLVGTKIYLEQKDTDAIKMWEPGKLQAIANVRRSDGKNYTALNNVTTGTVKPTHSRGSKFDGDAGVQWRFDDPGYGWGVITAIASPTVCTVNILSRIPDGAVLVANASTRWALQLWGTAETGGPVFGGDYLWPSTIAFWKERLVLGFRNSIVGSVAGDYENFKTRDDGGLITTEMGFRFDLATEQANLIRWMVPSDEALLIGTGGDEHALTKATSSEPFGPDNAATRKQSGYGSRYVGAIPIGEGVLFVQKSGRKIRDMKIAESVDERWVAQDVTVLAEHVTKGKGVNPLTLSETSGILRIEYQKEPDQTLWGVRSDGALVGLTLNREQEVRGWHPHVLGGFSDVNNTLPAQVESLCVIPAPSGDRDEIWMIVKRVINGVTKRYVEYMEAHFEEGDDQEDAWYVDCGLKLDNTIAQTLQPGAGADVIDSSDVLFTAGGATFVPGDVGREIHYRFWYYDERQRRTWRTAKAQIQTYVNNTNVRCLILSPWPNLSLIPVSKWRMTVLSVSGLGHLEGQTLQVFADGAKHSDCIVSGGQIFLDGPRSKVIAGLKYTSIVQPMPLDAGSGNGSSHGKLKRVNRAILRFDNTLWAKYGRDEADQLDTIIPGGGFTNDPTPNADNEIHPNQAPDLFTGGLQVAWPDGYDGDALLTVVQDKPFPMTVTCIVPGVDTTDSGP